MQTNIYLAKFKRSIILELNYDEDPSMIIVKNLSIIHQINMKEHKYFRTNRTNNKPYKCLLKQ